MVDYILYLSMEALRRNRLSKKEGSRYLFNACLEKNRDQFLSVMNRLSKSFQRMDQDNYEEGYHGFAPWIQSHIFRIAVISMETRYPRLMEDHIDAYLQELDLGLRLVAESKTDETFKEAAQKLDQTMEDYDEIFEVETKRGCRVKRSIVADIVTP